MLKSCPFAGLPYQTIQLHFSKNFFEPNCHLSSFKQINLYLRCFRQVFV